MANQEIILKAEHICKSFSQVVALNDVSFELRAGEVMALMGENGAGKSTLIKIITGLYTKDSGKIVLDGKEISPKTVLESQLLGIQTVYQELNLSPFLTVAENLFLGHELKNKHGLIDWKKTNEEANRIMRDMAVPINATDRLMDLTAALQQMVAIARAVIVNAKVLILDEPSSSLDADEVNTLFREIRRLKDKGMGIIYITHRMNEVFEISDRLTILRNGQLVGMYDAAELDMPMLVTKMIGSAADRAIVTRKPENPQLQDAPVLFSMKNICKKNRLHNVSMEIKKGEILGVAGLLGSGRTELAKIIFGDDQDYIGEIIYDGKPCHFRSPRRAIENGIAYCTEERRSEGIFALMGIDDNIVMPSIDNYTSLGVINERKKRSVVNDFIKKLSVKTPGAKTQINKLSGGNQQKALVARWLCMDTKLIIFDEPTRGIDVGAKSEIERLIQQLAASGLSVLLISSEFEELVRGCDRIMVLYEGHIVDNLVGDDISCDRILDKIAEGSKLVARKNSHANQEVE